jgi:pyruvate/2-oxoglutarate dehydrogenase complex dihydrolipoamide acyltransferase (E2) component
MKQEIRIPDFEEEVEEVEISEWHVAEGDKVTKGMRLAELLAEKAAVDLESEYEGTIVKILQPEGAIVKVGDSVAVVETA